MTQVYASTQCCYHVFISLHAIELAVYCETPLGKVRPELGLNYKGDVCVGGASAFISHRLPIIFCKEGSSFCTPLFERFGDNRRETNEIICNKSKKKIQKNKKIST